MGGESEEEPPVGPELVGDGLANAEDLANAAAAQNEPYAAAAPLAAAKAETDATISEKVFFEFGFGSGKPLPRKTSAGDLAESMSPPAKQASLASASSSGAACSHAAASPPPPQASSR